MKLLKLNLVENDLAEVKFSGKVFLQNILPAVPRGGRQLLLLLLICALTFGLWLPLLLCSSALARTGRGSQPYSFRTPTLYLGLLGIFS